MTRFVLTCYSITGVTEDPRHAFPHVVTDIRMAGRYADVCFEDGYDEVTVIEHLIDEEGYNSTSHVLDRITRDVWESCGRQSLPLLV